MKPATNDAPCSLAIKADPLPRDPIDDVRLARQAGRRTLCARLLTLTLLTVCLPAGRAQAQGDPISGTAMVTGTPGASTLPIGSSLPVTIQVDLTSVTGMGPGGGSVAAVLGGYQVEVLFDRSRLQYDSVQGGLSPQYSSPPTATTRSVANANGRVVVVASQVSPTAPTGLASVAVVNFTATAPGPASVATNPLSLSSAYQPGPPGMGPALIPGTGDSHVVTVTYDVLSSTATSFYTVTPCRLVDTRAPTGPFGGPSLDAGTIRGFSIANLCGIPSTAKAVSLNVTTTRSSSLGHLTVFPGGTLPPLVSTQNYSAGQTRANNAVVSLSTDGRLVVQCVVLSGSTDVILDVNGYFQ